MQKNAIERAYNNNNNNNNESRKKNMLLLLLKMWLRCAMRCELHAVLTIVELT